MVVSENPSSDHLKKTSKPQISKKAFVHDMALVLGEVYIEEEVFIAPFASIRADEGSPFYIGKRSNIQDGVVLHALETMNEEGEEISANLITYNNRLYSIYVGSDVSIAHQAQIHGPSIIKDNTFIGMQSFIFKSRVGNGCVIEPGAKVIGVNIRDNKFVPAGSIIESQKDADNLKDIDNNYKYANLNRDVVRINRALADAYIKEG